MKYTLLREIEKSRQEDGLELEVERQVQPRGNWTTKLAPERNSPQEMARAPKRRTGIRTQKKDELKQGRKKKRDKSAVSSKVGPCKMNNVTRCLQSRKGRI
jgi:hypothetical protein